MRTEIKARPSGSGVGQSPGGWGQGWGPSEKDLTVVTNMADQIFLEGW